MGWLVGCSARLVYYRGNRVWFVLLLLLLPTWTILYPSVSRYVPAGADVMFSASWLHTSCRFSALTMPSTKFSACREEELSLIHI